MLKKPRLKFKAPASFNASKMTERAQHEDELLYVCSESTLCLGKSCVLFFASSVTFFDGAGGATSAEQPSKTFESKIFQSFLSFYFIIIIIIFFFVFNSEFIVPGVYQAVNLLRPLTPPPPPGGMFSPRDETCFTHRRVFFIFS
jgi:hypothetical protein